MPNRRSGRALAAMLLLVAGATAASAERAPKRTVPRPACPMLADPANDDAVVGHDRGRWTTPSLDVVSADVAADPGRITVVVRLADLPPLDTGSPTGAGYQVAVSAGSRGLQFRAQRTPLEQRFRAYVTGAPAPGLEPGERQVADPAGTFDTASDEIRMTLPLSALRGLLDIRRGDTIGRLSVTSYREAGSPNGVFPATSGASADTARSSATHRVGGRGCIPVGEG